MAIFIFGNVLSAPYIYAFFDRMVITVPALGQWFLYAWVFVYTSFLTSFFSAVLSGMYYRFVAINDEEEVPVEFEIPEEDTILDL